MVQKKYACALGGLFAAIGTKRVIKADMKPCGVIRRMLNECTVLRCTFGHH